MKQVLMLRYPFGGRSVVELHIIASNYWWVCCKLLVMTFLVVSSTMDNIDYVNGIGNSDIYMKS